MIAYQVELSGIREAITWQNEVHEALQTANGEADVALRGLVDCARSDRDDFAASTVDFRLLLPLQWIFLFCSLLREIITEPQPIGESYFLCPPEDGGACILYISMVCPPCVTTHAYMQKFNHV